MQELKRSNSDPCIVDKSTKHTLSSHDVTSSSTFNVEDSFRLASIDNAENPHVSGEDSIDEAHPPGNGCGRGIVKDFKQTVGTHWKGEMTNFGQKTIAVSFFIFFAAISPAITFGAIYAKATHNYIGAVEMITATAWCGIVYALIGGQPMMINGGTGPVLAFTEILYKMSKSIDVPFLTFNAWIGIWVFIYMTIAAFVDLNRIIVHATRFTDEIFSLLIAAIFIINALGNPFAPVGIFYYFHEDHVSHQQFNDDPYYSHMSSALLSFILCIGTVQLAFALRKTKFSPFLPNQVLRNAVTDFAVVLSIAIMTIVSQFAFKDVPTETLNVPDSFAPTFACCTDACDTNWPEDCPNEAEPFGRRPWLINLFDLNGKSWVPFMAAGPAVLAFILVFLDDGITWHLINHPSHKLKHGAAYNYDTLIIGFMVLINSILGLPWLVAATVRSLNHVHALAEKSPDGKILSVLETRLTHLGIHLLCFVSIFALDALKVIPMPVLYGVFLFMGLVSLGTNQFWGRVQMFFMEPSQYPKEYFTKYVKPNRMHLFTAIQGALFVCLYMVKAIKTIAIAFPIIIALCIPTRLYLLTKIFTEEELLMIDSDDETVRAYLTAKKEQDAANKKALDVEGAQQKEGDNDDEDQNDMICALPTRQDQDMEDRRAKRYGRRRKSTSCPQNIFYEESESFVAPAFSRTDSMMTEGEQSDTSSSRELDVAPLPATAPTRRRRKKTISCPTHMLFTEAERHVNQNYFFG